MGARNRPHIGTMDIGLYLAHFWSDNAQRGLIRSVSTTLIEWQSRFRTVAAFVSGLNCPDHRSDMGKSSFRYAGKGCFDDNLVKFGAR